MILINSTVETFINNELIGVSCQTKEGPEHTTPE